MYIVLSFLRCLKRLISKIDKILYFKNQQIKKSRQICRDFFILKKQY